MLMSRTFVTHHPFAGLVELGWKLEHLGAPLMREGAEEFVRVATFDRGGQGVSVDVDRHGQMSQFATYTAGEDITLVAETAAALLLLAARPATATVEELTALPDISAVAIARR